MGALTVAQTPENKISRSEISVTSFTKPFVNSKMDCKFEISDSFSCNFSCAIASFLSLSVGASHGRQMP